jgi:hypothetical protein
LTPKNFEQSKLHGQREGSITYESNAHLLPMI